MRQKTSHLLKMLTNITSSNQLQLGSLTTLLWRAVSTTSRKWNQWLTKTTFIFVNLALQKNTGKVSWILNQKSFKNLIILIETKRKHRTQALKRSLMFLPPSHLIINLKRFIQTGVSFIKNQKRISFPLKLSIDDFMIHMVHKDNEEEV